MNRRRNRTQSDAKTQSLATAQRLARTLGAEPHDFRLVEIRFHDGRQWTLVSMWQQKIGESWKDVPWTALND